MDDDIPHKHLWEPVGLTTASNVVNEFPAVVQMCDCGCVRAVVITRFGVIIDPNETKEGLSGREPANG